jgi:hypothetical protein
MMPETTGEQKQYLAWHMIRESSVHNAKEEEVGMPCYYTHPAAAAAAELALKCKHLLVICCP